MAAKDKSDEAEPKKKGSLVANIAVFLILTLVASGIGFGAAMFVGDTSSTTMDSKKVAADADSSKKPEENAQEDGVASGDKKKEGGEEGEIDILTAYAKPLQPILTNLASPSKIWVRMELAVVTKEQPTEKLLEHIHQDLFAFMRTVKLHHVQGPSGFLNLKAELLDRAKIRSEGNVQQILVRTLLFE